MLVGVPSYALGEVWDQVEPLVQRCLDETHDHRYLAWDVHNMLRAGDAQLWVDQWPGVTTIVVTQIQVFPRAKECCILMVCGKQIEGWRDMLQQLIDGSKKLGCTYASAYTRPGIVKALRDWDRRMTYIVKEL